MLDRRVINKRIDGRVAKSLRIKEQVHESIVGAYIELIREGIPVPTARETARRAHLSLRVIFKHFASLSQLRIAAISRVETQSRAFYAQNRSYEGPLERRIEQLIQRQTRLLEIVTPFRRAALMVESVDATVAAALRRARQAAVDEIKRALGPTLKVLPASEGRRLVTKLHVVCSWPSWETLRVHHKLPASQARALVMQMMLNIVRDSLSSRKRRSKKV